MRTSRKLIHLHLSRIRKKFSVHTTIEIMRCTGETLAYPKHPIKLTPRGAEVFTPVSQWGKHHKNRPLPENLPKRRPTPQRKNAHGKRV